MGGLNGRTAVRFPGLGLKLPFERLLRRDTNVVHYRPEITRHYVIMSNFSAPHKRPRAEEKPAKRSLASANTHERWRLPLTFSQLSAAVPVSSLVPPPPPPSASLCRARPTRRSSRRSLGRESTKCRRSARRATARREEEDDPGQRLGNGLLNGPSDGGTSLIGFVRRGFSPHFETGSDPCRRDSDGNPEPLMDRRKRKAAVATDGC